MVRLRYVANPLLGLSRMLVQRWRCSVPGGDDAVATLGDWDPSNVPCFSYRKTMEVVRTDTFLP